MGFMDSPVFPLPFFSQISSTEIPPVQVASRTRVRVSMFTVKFIEDGIRLRIRIGALPYA